LAFTGDRFGPEPFQVTSGDTMAVMTPIFRPGLTVGGAGRGSGELRERGRPPFPRRGERPDRGPAPRPADGAVIIELDRETILKTLVPALAARHFASHDDTAYRIAILAESAEPRVLYSSTGEWNTDDIANPDARVNLFGPRRPPPPGGRARGPGPRGPFPGSVISAPWQLVVKHLAGSLEAGSLEDAVEQVRTRNLAIAFGILVVLSAALITVVVSSQRAHTLGQLQMEFAAGVSHELRTPLAVIRSAAHNLRSGIVRDKEGVEEYAAIVQEEARRLSEMVEEVLLYSETQSGRKKYKLEAIDVNEVIDRAITNLSPSMNFDETELTTHIDPDLPPAKADPAALAQCVQNLLSNAFKYGKKGETAQIEIVAQYDRGADEIRLRVIDHGPGIDRTDERQLFEAFYRGRNVASSVPGNGLGLHLVKRIMQAQAGRVTYSPAPQGGASFTLHIPAAS
jgi:signal transduction histidine kinase